jgi:hypothetical protein
MLMLVFTLRVLKSLLRNLGKKDVSVETVNAKINTVFVLQLEINVQFSVYVKIVKIVI